MLHVVSGSVAECMACIVRIPTEVVKQRTQTAQYSSSISALRGVLASKEGTLGLYRGLSGTLLREIPFTMIQFPLWEAMKTHAARRAGRDKANPVEAAICGMFAGGLAAALTTPMDVIKTRVMLAKEKQGWLQTLTVTLQNEGKTALFKGIGPRMAWISVGGFIFLGGYSAASDAMQAVGI